MPGDAFGFQDRARFVEGVEGVGCLEEVVGQQVGTEFMEDERNGLAELKELFSEGQFGGLGEDDFLRRSKLDRKSVV